MRRSSLFTVVCGAAFVFGCVSGCVARRPAEAHTRSVSVGGVPVAYTDVGAGADVLLFVHGWACDRSVWHDQLPPPAGRRYLLVDLPGHGTSGAPSEPLSLESFAHAVEAVLTDAKVERVVLVGHSNGVPVIREVALRCPLRLRGLVMVDGAVRPFLDDAAALDDFVAMMEGTDYRERVDQAFLGPMLSAVHDEAERERLRASMLATPQRTLIEAFRAVQDPRTLEDRPVPLRTLMAMARQPAWDDAYRAYVAERFPRLEWREFSDVSHFLMLDDSQGFERELARFLATLPP
ncbi:MAG: alpha/beta hydrolase [Planctomycetes bacterium]|nr:alpha/beta hydrolase [Planctomycetota bacterium]